MRTCDYSESIGYDPTGEYAEPCMRPSVGSCIECGNRGNPNWGHAQIPSLNAQQKPTMFSRMLAEYRLTEENCIRDFRARHWIRKHAKLYYVPEYLLKAIGEEVGPEDVL